MADILGGFGSAFNIGQNIAQSGFDAERRNRLSELASQAYSTPTGERNALLGQMAAVDPASAQAQEQAFATGDDRRNRTLVNMAKLLTGAPPQYREGIYQRIKPDLSRLGLSQVPDTYTPEVGALAEQLVSAWGGLDGKGVPSELQTFRAMTQGMPEEDILKARRIQLGLDGRASSAGFGFELVENADGTKSMGRTNPRTGVFEVYDPQSGQLVPLFGGAQAGAPQPQRQPGMTQVQYATSDGQPIPPEEMAAAQAAFAADARGESFSFPVGGQPQSAPAGLGVSRTPEAEAAAVEAAKQRAQLAALPQREAIQTQGALDRARGEARIENDATRQAEADKKQRQARETLSMLDEAEKLLPQATGGGLEAARDSALGYFGVATEGSKATAALNLIAAKLIANVPRFEGPQSNIDVQFYREAAGDLANPQLPNEVRMAALQTMRNLQQKYADDGRVGPQQPGSIRPGAVEDGYRFKGGDPADPNNWERI